MDLERIPIERTETRRRLLRRDRGPLQEAVDDRTSATRAFERALAEALLQWRDAARRANVSRADVDRVDRLAEQLRLSAVGGAHGSVHTALPPAQALGFVGLVRRCLLEDTRTIDAGIRAGELSTMLLALEAAADTLTGRGTHSLAGTLPDGAGAELVVEVAHDMRSPLTSILFLVETLRKGHSGPVNAVQERQLALVYSAAYGLSAIASDVIELARGADRLMERTPIPFSVSEVFHSVYDMLLPMAEEKGLALRLVPPPADFRVGYPSGLCRVLLNLATNGVKFTSAGMVEVSATQISATRLEFSVRDTGPGIPAEVMGELFQPFRRRDTGSQAFSSAGLGLAICSRLVSRMDGQLRVESGPETGTRFFFELDLPVDSRL